MPTAGSIVALEAFADVHIRVAHCPCTIAAGFAERDTVGAGGGATLTVVEASRAPPSPTAAIVYCVVVRGHTGQDPLGSTLPTPWSIEALEAFADVHTRVAHCPCAIAAGFAERDTVGAGGGRTT
ncbi:MAG: hypothetical protein ACRDH5_17535, partial [bacterium]